MVNLNGVGEDKAVQDLLSDKFTNGTNAEAAEIAIALRTLISGQNSLLENQARQSAELSKVRQRMAEMDAAAEKWESNREGFIQEVLDRAEKIRSISPERAIARGALEFQDAITIAKADRATQLMEFHELVRRQPTVTVISPGELVQVMEGGRPTNRMFPEVIRIKDMVWTLQPGVPTEVPKLVADVIRQRRNSEDETHAREQVLSQNLESEEFNKRWSKINSTYKSPTQ